MVAGLLAGPEWQLEREMLVRKTQKAGDQGLKAAGQLVGSGARVVQGQ